MENKQCSARISEVIERQIDRGKIKEAACAAVSKEGVLCRGCWGGVGEHTIYRIFSMTKPLTALGAALLFERGKLDPAQPIREFFPVFERQQVWNGQELVPLKREITVQDLMDMVSGMAYPGDGTYPGDIMREKIARCTRDYDAGQPVGRERILQAFAETPLCFQPGEAWHYGVSADVLGCIIEEASGKDLAVFMKEEIFEPLEMKKTGFWVEKEECGNIADIYSGASGELRVIDAKAMKTLFLREPHKRPPFLAAGSGLYSTLEDYSHFVEMLLNQGVYKDKVLLRPEGIRTLACRRLSPEQAATIYFDGLEGYNYGSLMRHLEDEDLAMGSGKKGEYGWDGLLGNDFFVCPEEGIGYIYFQQILEGADYAFRRKLHRAIYELKE